MNLNLYLLDNKAGGRLPITRLVVVAQNHLHAREIAIREQGSGIYANTWQQDAECRCIGRADPGVGEGVLTRGTE